MEKFGSLIDDVPVPILVLDADVAVHYANTAAAEYINAESGKILRRRWGEVIHCVNSGPEYGGCGGHPSCGGCSFRHTVESVLESKAPQRKLEQFILQEGKNMRRVHFRIHASLHEADGEQYVIIVLDDISEILNMKGSLPVCAVCRKVRREDNTWEMFETYMSSKTGIMITHTVCPDCLASHYPE